MSGWIDRVDFPEIGPGWVRMSKPRPGGHTGPKHVDHVYLCPISGTKFRSIKSAFDFIANGGQNNPAPSRGKPKQQ